MIEDPDPEPDPEPYFWLVDTDPGGQKNTWIRIMIRNTAFRNCTLAQIWHNVNS